MGATYSSASAAGAFTTKRGNQLVFMWEELCESNVHPQVPTWNLVFVGDANGAMDRVFRAAASADGGSLRGARGRDISPEGYIGRWMKEFSQPRDMCGVVEHYNFELSMGKGHYDPINIGEFESKSYPKPDVIFDTITEYGLPDVVERIKRGENVSLSLFEHGELMVMLNKMGVYIWRMMRLSYPVGWASPELKLKFEPTNEPAPSYPMAMRIGEVDFVLKDGVYRYDNNVFYNAIKTYSQHEINFPGSYKRFIKGLREHVKSAPKAPTTMVIDVIPEENRAFSDGRIEKLLGESFTVDDLLTKGASLMVRSLWYYDVEISLERQPLTALIPMTEQLELI